MVVRFGTDSVLPADDRFIVEPLDPGVDRAIVEGER
jgi:hypothetical protein